jgi:hypothetical protein
VPFLLGAGTGVAGALVLTTVHEALDAADRGEIAQLERDDLDRLEREEELQIGAAVGNQD